MKAVARCKEWIIDCFGRVIRIPLVFATAEGFFRRHVNVIYYHGVWNAGAPHLSMFTGTSLDRFVADLREMQRVFDFMSLADILTHPREGARGKPALAITFDDGFDLTNGGATDVLDDLGIPATVFVISACVHYRALMWQHQFFAIRAMRGDEIYLRELNKVLVRTGIGPIGHPDRQDQVTRAWPSSRKDEYAQDVWRACDMPPMDEVLQSLRPYFDWRGLEEWIRRGHAVGSHTFSHPFCSTLLEQEVETEFVAPALELRARLGLGAVPFAYPFGDRLSPSIETAVARRNLFSCLLGTGRLSKPADGPHRIDRIWTELGVDRELFGRPLAKAIVGGALG